MDLYSLIQADGREESFSNKIDWNNNLNQESTNRRHIHTRTTSKYYEKKNRIYRNKQTNELQQQQKSDLVSELMSILVLCIYFSVRSFSCAIFQCARTKLCGWQWISIFTIYWIRFVCNSIYIVICGVRERDRV